MTKIFSERTIDQLVGWGLIIVSLLMLVGIGWVMLPYFTGESCPTALLAIFAVPIAIAFALAGLLGG